MSRIRSRIVSGFLAAAMCLGFQSTIFSASAAEPDGGLSTLEAIETTEGITISNDKISTNSYKDEKYNNPVSSEFFCADPTSVEYNGRLYLYGTNDHEQYEIAGPDKDNTYEKIKSMVVLSTDDMVNWIYHGEINIGEIAPWITNSWAPSIVSREEADGKTHFYLYFSNNGLGVGVIHSTDPVGPWDDPLGQPLISSSTPGLKDCPNPFDPGAVIDDDGVGWLSFGAGKASDGTDYMPGSNRIVRLGKDMVSIDSEFAEIPAPYHFEASELNYINDTYVYTYNTDWSDHSKQWEYDCPVPSQCSMVYMTTKTPLDSDSWEMRGEYFINPGTAGFDYSNNHTHLHKYKGQYYIFYHTLMLKRGMGITGSYRSLNVDTINVDEETVTIEKCGGTKKGPNSISSISPFTINLAAELNNTADISFDTSDQMQPGVVSDGEGSWFSVRSVEFTPSDGSAEPEAPAELSLTNVDTIQYNITVLSVDKNTTVSMYPSTKDGVDCVGSVDVAGAGKYTITCDMGNAEGLMNMGFFKVSNDALITFVIDSMTVNGKYEFDLSAELTNTREWADGLRNIWNGYSDGDLVYGSDYAEFRYVGNDDAIKLFATEIPSGNTTGNAPLLNEPVTFYGTVKGTGRVEVRLDSPDGTMLTSIDFDSPDRYQTIFNKDVAQVGGTHDLYFVFSGKDISMKAWTFAPTDGALDTVLGDVNADGEFTIKDAVMMQKYLLGMGRLTAPGSADLCEDGRLNIFDLSAMKSALSEK